MRGLTLFPTVNLEEGVELESADEDDAETPAVVINLRGLNKKSVKSSCRFIWRNSSRPKPKLKLP